MALPTKYDAGMIAESCREYVAAFERRNADHEWMTFGETMALAVLRYNISAIYREDVSPLSETAA